ncbi:MAG: DNA mismatch repair endonuclease MutL [Chlamydiota bacterium]
MGSQIRVLDDNTINKIAAGEVVENPSSVVKELVDNSLDAGATEIAVEIKAGGRQLIKVSDNGCGMSQDDALLSLERHATSKIRQADDILDLSTMGFRGEAIPSVASVSKFNLISCPEGAQEATLIMVDGGKIVDCRPAARSQGTTVEVKSLFFNVPVRKKFLRSVSRDAAEINKVVTSLALANPLVNFRLINDNKQVLSLSASMKQDFHQAFQQRVSEVLGHSFFDRMLPVAYQDGDFKLEGFIGEPSFTRTNRTGQYLFINKRPVHSPGVSIAVANAYGTRLQERRFPVFVLQMKLSGKFVDVNVHPQKREVRFQQEYILRECVAKAVGEALVAPSLPKERASATSSSSSSMLLRTDHSPACHFRPSPREQKISFSEIEIVEAPEDEKQPDLQVTLAPCPVGIHGNYIFTKAHDTDGGLRVYDRRRLELRIAFDDLLERWKQSDIQKQQGVQALLVPISLEVASTEAAQLRPLLSDLNKLGLSISEFGGNAFMIDSLPTILDSWEAQDLVHDMLADLKEPRELKSEHKLALILARKAVSAKTSLTIEEAQVILRKLMVTSDPHLDPQGRPISAVFKNDDLSRMFD